VVDLTARAGLVPEDFVEEACREAPIPDEAARARQFKEETAERRLSLRPRTSMSDLGRLVP
jgi:hypothetical protein